MNDVFLSGDTGSCRYHHIMTGGSEESNESRIDRVVVQIKLYCVSRAAGRNRLVRADQRSAQSISYRQAKYSRAYWRHG